MRLPSDILVVDTNILIGIAAGRKTADGGWALVKVSAKRSLVISSDTVREAVGLCDRVDILKPAGPNLVKLIGNLTVVDQSRYASLAQDAARTLRDAVPSRNASTSDAHILAVAWLYDADIWSHDRDFAGTGWPSWSSANLIAALAAEKD